MIETPNFAGPFKTIRYSLTSLYGFNHKQSVIISITIFILIIISSQNWKTLNNNEDIFLIVLNIVHSIEPINASYLLYTAQAWLTC